MEGSGAFGFLPSRNSMNYPPAAELTGYLKLFNSYSIEAEASFEEFKPRDFELTTIP